MKLMGFPFGRRRQRDSVPTMNRSIEPNYENRYVNPENEYQSRDQAQYRQPGNLDTGMGKVCNPPPRTDQEKRGQTNNKINGGLGYSNDQGGCSPYGRLLPDAEKYTKKITDMGNAPYIFNIGKEILENGNYRSALWTGEKIQMIAMSIPAGEEIGKELHEDTDQLLMIYEGEGEAFVGRAEDRISSLGKLTSGAAVIIPAGMYHNIKNTSSSPLKLLSIYAPPHHPYGRIEKTQSKY